MSESSKRNTQDSRSKKHATLKRLEYIKEWGKNNPDKVKAYKQKYHQKNRDEVIIRATRWNKDNRQKRHKIQEEYRTKNADYIRTRNLEYRRKYRKDALAHYSNGKNKCTCCGESIYWFLTIDHINGDGNAERKANNIRGGHHFYYWLKRHGYPPGYQVLCFNCNHGKFLRGVCPHNRMPESTIMPL